MDSYNFIPLAFGEIFSPTTAAYALAALGLAVHFGFTGLLNFGQAGFMAVGGYAFAITAVKLEWPLWGSFLATIVASVIFALILGVPTLRLRADYLSIVTIAAAEIIRLSVKTPEFSDVTGGSEGINGAARTFNELNPIAEGRFGVGVLTYSADQWWVRIVGWGLVASARTCSPTRCRRSSSAESSADWRGRCSSSPARCSQTTTARS